MSRYRAATDVAVRDRGSVGAAAAAAMSSISLMSEGSSGHVNQGLELQRVNHSLLFILSILIL
jgi:hypothetical protein